MLDIVEEPLEAGAVISGKYRLERPLGEGGMGVVWAAREVEGDKPVALKFLREGRTDPKSRARFLREAKAAIKVVHPHVARVHQVLETDIGVPFLVMDLLEGDSLRGVLRRRRSLALDDVLRVFLPITEAVEAAHALGIVHRDLKPENIFLVNGHDVRVLDFGIAKQLVHGDETATSTSLTSTGAFLGTPHYMAPEQIFGEDDLDARADIWALGVILYELLAGVRPFEATGVGPLMRRITLDPIRPLSQVVPTIAPAIDAIVGRMLSRAKEMRPSLAEVRAVLTSAVSAEPIAVTTADTRLDPVRRDPVPPPSTTIGVASKRPTLDAPARTESHTPMTIAIGVIVGLGAMGAGAILLVPKLMKKETTSATPSATPPASISPAPETPSAIASADGDASPAPSGHATANAADKPDHLGLARKAYEKRDGATCVHEYDLYDSGEPRESHRSTTPSNSYAHTRAECMMLAGDCAGGRKLLLAARSAKAGTKTTDAEQATDKAAAELCSSGLTPREDLLRAHLRLKSVAAGSRKASAAECRQWYATVSSLDGKVEPRSSTDDVRTVRVLLGKDTATCLARAGDCPGSFKVFRDERIRALPSADAVSEYKALTDEIHLCQGAP